MVGLDGKQLESTGHPLFNNNGVENLMSESLKRSFGLGAKIIGMDKIFDLNSVPNDRLLRHGNTAFKNLSDLALNPMKQRQFLQLYGFPTLETQQEMVNECFTRVQSFYEMFGFKKLN